MKANEMMIGDKVFIAGSPTRTIKHLTKCKVGYIANDTETRVYYTRPEFVFGIPLTTEILEKNAYPEDGIWYSFGDFYVAPYGDCFVIHIHSYDDKRDFLCRIHYIHELQHALRLCGLNDLAENFKI